jgi:uncharacterized protein (TIGR03437 family)
VGEAARLAGKSLYAAPVSATRVRYIVAGWNQTPLPAGALVRFVAGVSPTAEQRGYAVTFANLAATSPSGVTAPLAGSAGTITVVAGTGPRLAEAGVLNAASFAAGPLAPGEIATLMGPRIGPVTGMLPASGPSAPFLGGVSVWFDGVQAPILYAGPSQINLVVPYGTGGASTELVVRRDGQILASLAVPLAKASPGLFTLSAGGTGPAAILNQDGTVNSVSAPARREQVVSLFATGAGVMDPPGADGAISQGTAQRPVLPVSVRIGGRDAEILYAGAAPGLIAGVLQVNCRIPADAPVGPAVEVVLGLADTSSLPGSTMSIE